MAKTLQLTGMDTGSTPPGQFNIVQPTDAIQIPNALIGVGSTPSLALGSAAGSGATFSIVGSNTAGKITLNAGTGILTSGTVMTMTFANSFAYPSGCAVIFSPGNSNFAAVISTISSTTGTTTVVVSVTAGLSISTTYIGFYTIIGW